MPRLKRGMTTREVADRGLSLAKGCLAPAELSICLHPLGFVWPTVVLFISKHCFHYRFAGWLRSRKSWLRLRKTSKMVAQFNQDGRRQMTAAIAWCRPASAIAGSSRIAALTLTSPCQEQSPAQ